MDDLFLQGKGRIRVGRYLTVPNQNGVRIVKLIEQRLASPDIQHRKGGIGQMPDTAHGQRIGYGGHRVIDGQLFDDHMAEHPGSQRGENVGLDAASQSV